MKSSYKIIYAFVAFTLLLNSTVMAATLYGEQQEHTEFSTLFGESVYICSGENSFDLDVSDFEKLLHEIKDNKEHDFHFLSDLDFVKPENYFYLYLANSVTQNFVYSSHIELDDLFYTQPSPRAPPFSFA